MRPRILAALCLILAAPAQAQAPADPDWPCIQRKVGTISAGTVWSGPDLASAGPWDKDFDAAALAQKLASRRTPMAEVDGLIEAFAQAAGPEKSVRLTRVFAGVLELTNTERDRILNGITRYARGQHKLADRIREASDKVGEAKDSPMAAESKETLELENQLQWDTRIFEERRRSLTYVCETPVLLEQRVFEIARRIQQRL
ncbi:hypothetical protein D3874_26020 [Oleomonas cavernae]|uniref:Uncharacterized protein n=1 Tax=Oleomonas cavernae TaxID=2320859 RepID=A0A418VTV7_9PROT|nr:hypothetical protein [Oleomonas cavernae]RJF80579.1 hypothetical protein D3874_26020 [Oleomonas cavernae]